MHDNDRPVLVTGGTGKTGRRVARLLDLGGSQVRIGSRSGEPPFDWNQRTTWPAVVDGVGAVYLAYSPDLAFPGAAETIGAFVATAVGHGAERFVLLSGRGELGAEASEERLCDTAPQWTVLRSSFMMQNFSEDFVLDAVLAGSIAFPAGDVAEPFVDADDLAEAAVAALTDPHHDHQVYEVTGPRLLTFWEVAAELSGVTARQIAYQPVSPDGYVALAVAQGVPEEEIAPLAELFSAVLDGRNAHTTHDLELILRRPPRDFRDYALAAARTGVWDVEPLAPARA